MVYHEFLFNNRYELQNKKNRPLKMCCLKKTKITHTDCTRTVPNIDSAKSIVRTGLDLSPKNQLMKWVKPIHVVNPIRENPCTHDQNKTHEVSLSSKFLKSVASAFQTTHEVSHTDKLTKWVNPCKSIPSVAENHPFDTLYELTSDSGGLEETCLQFLKWTLLLVLKKHRNRGHQKQTF